MANFCAKSTVDAETAEIEVERRDSLGDAEWEAADVILMNPPFTFWNDMLEPERSTVKSILGPLYHNHADKALAFIQRRIDAEAWAVLACVAPSPLLESNAGFRWREHIANEPALSLRLIGCFRGFNYFRGAVVEHVFLVIVRHLDAVTKPELPVQVILANDGFEDQAIRQLRRDPNGADGDYPDWSVFKAEATEFPPPSWLPRSRESTRRLHAPADKGYPGALTICFVLSSELALANIRLSF